MLCKEIFDLIDEDKSGTITNHEFKVRWTSSTQASPRLTLMRSSRRSTSLATGRLTTRSLQRCYFGTRTNESLTFTVHVRYSPCHHSTQRAVTYHLAITCW